MTTATAKPKKINRAERFAQRLKDKKFKGKGSTIRITPNSKKKKKNKKKGIAQSREISVRESAAVRNTIYGTMRLGGVISFMDAGGEKESKAHLTTGTGNSSIGWVAKEDGSEGNDISVTIVVPASNPTLSIGVIGTAITVTVQSAGGNSQSSANEVITAIRASGAADALVSVNRGGEKGGANVQALSTTNLTGGGGTWLHMVHTLCGHEIDSIQSIFLDNRLLELGGSPDPRWATNYYAGFASATLNYGETDQEAIADLIDQLPDKWTSNDRQRGCAHVYTNNIFKESIYPTGEPDFSFIVNGKKLYDPRDGIDPAVKTFSNNAALVVLDYLLTPKQDGGCGIAIGDIDLANFEDAADVCDEAIPIAAGGTEPRYTINIDFEWDNQPRDMLEIFAQSMMGAIVKYNGKWRCFPGTWRVPVMSLTEDDIRGPISITTRNEKRQLFNRAKGTFLDPYQEYEQVDLPAVKNSTYLTEDGSEENWFDVDLTAVTSPGQGQRILKYHMEKSRQGISISFPASLKTYQLAVEDTIDLTVERYGWTNKEFLVVDIDFEVSGSEGAWKIEPILYLEETAEALYDWDVGEETEIDPAPDTNLPDPLTAIAPSNVVLSSGTSELFLRSDGTVFTRLKVAWDMSESPYILFGGWYELQFKETATSDWSHTENILGDSNFHHILNVQDGASADVRIRSVNALKFPSSWVTVTGHTVIGKTAAPSNVSNFTATKSDFGIIMAWDAISDLDADLYEIRVGASWAAGTLVTQSYSTSFRWEFRTAGTYNLMIKAVDTTGNYSTTEATQSLTINAPQAPVVSSVITGPNAVFTWTKPTADFAIREYEVRYGASYAAGTPVAIVTANDFILPVNWGGARTFWIAARDVAGNTGTADSEEITIQNPNAPVNLTTQAIKNQIAFDWYEPTITSLPIRRYHVYKGFLFSEAEYIGAADATFLSFTEPSPGEFYYQVVSEDTAGNRSDPALGPLTRIIVPNDFFIREDQELINYLKDPGDSVPDVNYISQPMGEPGRIYFPVATGLPVAASPGGVITRREALYTREEVLLANGWDSDQDAIDDGYTAYLSPSNTDPGTILFEIDYEVNIGQALIDLTYTLVQLGPNDIVVTTDIEISLDGVSWTTYTGYNQVFASNFRYARYYFNFEADTDFDVAYIEGMRAKLQLLKERDDIRVDVLAADHPAGTLVNFTKTFIDVQSIKFQPLGTAIVNWIVDFDIENPVQPNYARVLCWDENGDPTDALGTLEVYGAISIT